MRHLLLIFAAALTLLGETSLYDRGETLFFEKGCNGCHGTKAEGLHTYPSLANRPKALLTRKLKHYRAKESPTQMAQMMIPFAEPLTDAEIDALTTFLSAFKDEQKEQYEPGYSTWGDGGS